MYHIELAGSEFVKIAEDHVKLAQMWTTEAQRSYSSGMACIARSRVIAEQARRQLHKSDELLQWYEAYGPLPQINES